LTNSKAYAIILAVHIQNKHENNMFQNYQTITPISFLFIVATAFGVVMHDTQIDHAATVAVTAPAHMASVGAADAVSKSSEHLHVERVSFNAKGMSVRSVPKTQPRDDDRRYVQSKKTADHSGDGGSSWPSV
jgi:hypothetical protein